MWQRPLPNAYPNYRTKPKSNKKTNIDQAICQLGELPRRYSKKWSLRKPHIPSRDQTLRVTVGNMLSSPMSIENGVVQVAVLSMTFLSGNGHHMQGNRGTDKNPWRRRCLGHIYEPTDTTNDQKQY
jgi:hypothetical protein